jgi:hypothetical protein
MGKQGAPQKLEEEKHNCNLAPYDILTFKYCNNNILTIYLKLYKENQQQLTACSLHT